MFFTFNCYAKEITILYTGDTHAMLYPCHCPFEPDGGISRRATLIKELKKANPDALVLDSGSFFAGGLHDPESQNAQLDMQRTLVNLKAMEMMHYDAAAIGNDEFNFGRELLELRAAGIKVPFISCNIDLQKIAPFVIKDISGTRIGIIGVTATSLSQKAGNLKFIDPKTAVKKAVEELKKKNTDIIILLSGLEEDDDLELIKDMPEINIIISGNSNIHKERLTKLGPGLLLRPDWQGRRLGKASFVINDHKIISYKTEDPRLSDKINDDPDMAGILPRCFSDANCQKEGFIASCQNPGDITSRCQFTKPAKIELVIVIPKECRVCNVEPIVNYLKSRFPGLEVSNLYYPSPAADKLINATGAKALPIYLLGKEAEKENGFNEQLRKIVDEKDNFYMLKPAYSGVSYILGKKAIKGKLDLFISLFGKNAGEILEASRALNPSVHFLAIEKDGAFQSVKGKPESEEYLRSVCVKKYYPARFFDYISCRAKSIESTWWEDCAVGMDSAKITACAKGKEGAELLRDNLSLNKERDIIFGPTYLVDNIEMFLVEGVPTKEDLRKLINR